MRTDYLSETVTAIQPLDGYRLRATFADGFTGEVDITPLLRCGPIFEPLLEPGFFRSVKISSYGVPEWGDDLDLSPGSLRVWCEATRFMNFEETDAWIEEHSGAAHKVA